MTRPETRERFIQQGMQMNRMGVFLFTIQKLFTSPKKHALRREVFIDTPFGRVRTLWYGFENPDKAPLFIDLHGGGFVLGTPEMDEHINLELLKETGCKVISISYAKAPKYPFPIAVEQACAVVKQVWQHAEDFGIDPQRIAIGGHSAGANLATVACMKAKEEGELHFTCQILDYPPLDLATSPYDKPQPKGCIAPKMASMFNACYLEPSQAREPYASPLFAAQELLAGLPPALVILAGRDSLHDEGEAYAKKLKAAGVEVEVHDYPQAVHGFTMQPSEDTTHAVAKMVEFLKKHQSG